jgi:hypothetical protein
MLYWVAVPLLPGQAPPSNPPLDIGSAWDQLITGAIPNAPPDPALQQSQPGTPPSGIDKFLTHFFLETRTIYERYETNFTGNATNSGVINATDTGTFNPAGIPWPSAFQPGANRAGEFVDFGTNGFGSDRVNTHFAFRYRQDVTHSDIGSPAQNIIERSGGNRAIEFLEGSVQIDSKPTDGAFAGSSIEIGRLNIYGAELASLDGGAWTVNKPKFTFEIYGGRRFSLFSDPEQRGIGGANLTLKFNTTTSLELETLWYIRGSNKAVFRKRLGNRWLFSAYFRAWGGSPVDLSASALYTSRNGRDTLRAGFFQKLTGNDYSFDYTSDEKNMAASSPLYRLYLGPLAPYSQINVEAHHQFFANLRAGAAVVVRRLNSQSNIGPFDTSFADYRLNGQYFPYNKIEMDFEYHQRNSDRLSPLDNTTLSGEAGTGETSVKDLSANIRRAFGEGRFSLSGGVYYRRISEQDPFYYLTNLHQSGVLGSAWVRLDRRTRIYFDYSLDNDFFLLAPDLKNSQVMRLGVNWKY